MSDTESRFSRGSLLGNASVPLLSQPQIRGTIRRSNPDGGHTQPYWTGLASTSLVVEVGTTTGGILSTVTINFSTNNYNDAVAAVNAAAPTHVRWLESDGFPCVQDVHSGGKNYMRVTGGTAAAIFGMAVDPIPGGYSRAGDLAPAPADKQQSNPQTTLLLSHDENLTTSGINRAIVGALRGVDQALNDLDREVAVWRTVDCVFEASGGLRLNLLADPTLSNLRVSSEAVAQALADGYAVADIVQVLNTSRQSYYLGTPITRLVATDLTYGNGSPSNGAITWGTPGGSARRTYTAAAAQSLKQAAASITAVVGDTLVVPSATFVTNKVQPGDHVVIASSNNDTPFNHNGEFVVVAVPSETRLVVRPLGPVETKVDSTNDAPPALNTVLGGGLSFGTVAVYVGWYFRLSGKAGTASDSLRIQTSQSDTAGVHAFVRLPIAMTLREVISNGLIDNASFSLDGQIAYKNLANEFLLRNQFDTGITLPTMPANGGSPLLSKILAPFTTDDDPRFVLVTQSNGVDVSGANYPMRVYYNREVGGITITSNSRHNRGSDVWTKDVNGTVADRIDIGPAGIKIFHQTAADNSVITSEAWPQIPLTVNTADLATNAGALVPRFLIPSSSTGVGTTKYNLLFENKNTDNNIITRFYIKNNTGGYAISMNARWDNTNWNKDVNGLVASKFELDGNGALNFLFRQAGTNTAWADTVGSGWNGAGSFTDDIVNGAATITGQIGVGTVLGTSPIFNMDGSIHSPDLSKLLRTATSIGTSSSIYVTPAGDFYISYGCHWDQPTNRWVSEIAITGGGSALKLSATGIDFLQKSSGANWTDVDPGGAGWDALPLRVNSANAAVQGNGTSFRAGLEGNGGPTGTGVVGTGGTTSGPGVVGIGGPNSPGVAGTGKNQGAGVQGNGNTDGGPGVLAVGSSSPIFESSALETNAGNLFGLNAARRDTSGNLGEYHDWGGLPGGRIVRINEDWLGAPDSVTTVSASDTDTFGEKWTRLAGVTGGTPSVTTQVGNAAPIAASNCSGWFNQLNGGTAAYVNICTNHQTHFWNADSQLICEFEIPTYFPGVSGLFIGLSPTQLLAMPTNASPVIGIGARSTDANWQIIVGNGTTLVYTPTATALPSGSFKYVRFEIAGSSTAIGANKVRLWLNGLSSLPVEVTTGFPTARAMCFNILEVMASGLTLNMGGMDIYWKRRRLSGSNIAY